MRVTRSQTVFAVVVYWRLITTKRKVQYQYGLAETIVVIPGRDGVVRAADIWTAGGMTRKADQEARCPPLRVHKIDNEHRSAG
ncbi:hypothetical protein EVAR_79218_1 [Eumeta japonica]|uniref:Uncharacterized protein n=1 Tax=Eumeta variegata TaxID=151549 RepID=A0A4C1UTP2_EUMVA|nr:hypothetical protein EVAR_79218_1 [Eumeta japonica]